MDWNIEPFTIEELEETLRKITNKAPGPDGIPAEAFKNLTGDKKLQLLALINKWFEDEQIPREKLLANIALIF